MGNDFQNQPETFTYTGIHVHVSSNSHAKHAQIHTCIPHTYIHTQEKEENGIREKLCLSRKIQSPSIKKQKPQNIQNEPLKVL